MENKLPITRLSKYFSREDYDLQIQMGLEYVNGDLNVKLVLYSVDSAKTDIDDVYGEVGKDGIKYFPPVEFNAIAKFDSPTNKTYRNGFIKYLEPGNLTIYVYIKHLEELNIDIKYGDFIGYPESEDSIRFYSVSNDGRVVSDGKHNLFGYRPYYRTITCVPVQESEFRGV